MSTYHVALPMPPSVNKIWRPARGRPGLTRTSVYRIWIKKASLLARQARAGARMAAPFSHATVQITVDVGYTRDLDNVIKPVLDALEDARVIDNDRYVERIVTQRATIPNGCGVRVSVVEDSPARSCNACRKGAHR